MLDGRIERVNEVPHIEELNDGSWEMVVLKSYCCTFQDMLGEMFAGSDVDLNYDPLEPTVNNVEVWGYSNAKKLCKHLFVQRAERIVKEGWPAAAAHFAYLLAYLDGLEAAPGTDHDQLSVDDNSDIEPIPDETLVFKPKKIVGVSRTHGIWMFKIQFEKSTLSPEFYDRLRIGGRPASLFAASCFSTAEHDYCVEWEAQWKNNVPDDLWLDLSSMLRKKLVALAAPMDDLLWCADSSVCTINGDGPAYHLCMERDCFECEHAIRNVSNQPHYQDVALQELVGRTHQLEAEADKDSRSKWKKAVEFLATVLQAYEEQHPGDPGEMANAILGLLQEPFQPTVRC